MTDPETYRKAVAFQEYRRLLKLAEHNGSGRNPSMPGDMGKAMGARLQARADAIAEEFPDFPATVAKLDK